MKTIRPGLNFMALLVLAGGAAAPAFGNDNLTHEHLVFDKIKTTYNYDGGIVATWEVVPPTAPTGTTLGHVTYKLTVTGLTAGTNYSLLNLGLQSCVGPVVIITAPKAKFGSEADVVAGTMAELTSPKVINPVGLFVKDPNRPDLVTLDGDQVWFVTPTDSGGTLEITVEPAGLKEVGMTSWTNHRNTGYGSSHDTIPARSTPAK